MLKLILVRHGETQGNKLKRYIGKRTDEPLCPEAGNMLAQLAYPEVQAVYASPMIRCTQTAGILFPGKKLNIIDELAECDFGEFENKNYEKSLEEIDQAIKLFPQESKYYYSRGIFLHTLKRFHEALEDKNKAIELLPQKDDYYYSRSMTLSRLLKYEEALKDIGYAIHLNSSKMKYYKYAMKLLKELEGDEKIEE